MDKDNGPGKVLRFGAVVALVCALLFTAGAAGQRGGDFLHLWVGGHLVQAGRAEALYSPADQRAALLAVWPADSVPWAPRNDSLGAFFYPPPAALAYAPLGMMAPARAGMVHAVLHTGALCLAGVLLARLVGLGRSAGVLLVLACPASFHGHVLNQNGAWSLLVMVGSLLCLVRGKAVWAGLAAGLLLYKPSWLVLFGLIPIVLGGWRALFGMGISLGLLSGLSALLLGPGRWEEWLALAPRIADLAKEAGYPLRLQYGVPALGLRVLGPEGYLPGRLVGALLIAGAAVLAWKVREKPVLAGSFALGVASLGSPHAHPYDLVGALPALGLLLVRAPRWGMVAVILHHGGQLLEGTKGSGWALPPASLGLVGALGICAYFFFFRSDSGFSGSGSTGGAPPASSLGTLASRS